MNSSTMRGMRRGLMLLAAGTVVAGGAEAQQPARLPPGAIVQPLGQDDGAELRRHLTTLADNPRSLDALIGAGRAALRMGDAEAALSFFGRAEQISPRDARVKAGMASSFVQLGRAPAALNLFAEAVALGAPVPEIAGDRGLAYDMVGDPRRAQQDYALSLGRRTDPEIQRRLALSLAISGEREAALRIIAPQLTRNERAAWRTQALVLALTGDAAGANRTAQGTMPPGAAFAMAPFLARLAALSPQQKAMAVHFGHFPAAGRPQGGVAQVDTSADPRALALAMGGAAPAPRAQSGTAAEAPAARRPRPGGSRNAAAPASRRRSAEVRDSSDPYGLRGVRQSRRRETRSAPQPAQRRPVEVAQADTSGEAPTAAPRPAPPQPRQQPAADPGPTQVAQSGSRWAGAPVISQSPLPQQQAPIAAPAATPQQQPAPSTGAGTVAAEPAPAERQPPPIASTSTSLPHVEVPAASLPAPTAPQTAPDASPGFALVAPEPETGRPSQPSPAPSEPLADIETLVNALPDEAPAPAAPAPAAPAPAAPEARQQPVRTAQRTPAPTPARPRQPAHPSRHWVQIAGGANRSALPREYARLSGQAPELSGRAAWTTPLNATNRLLVGPFASQREAQEFVNRLAQRQVAAFAWTSPAGQEIERLPTGR